MRQATTTADDGCTIAYRVWGNPDARRRVALVHSLAMDGGFWTETAAALGADTLVLALDCRGHGASDKPDGPYTVERFGDDLAAVMDAEGWQDAVVAGASMGGCVALAFAARHPARCKALGLIDTTAWYGEGAAEAWEGRGQKAREEGMAALVGFQKTRWFSDSFREAEPDRVEAAVKVFLANDVDAYLETCRMLGRADLRAALPGFDMPVAILVGEEDYATPPEMARAMQEQISGATCDVLPRVRHFTPLEVPARIAETLSTLGTS